jgi:hypothetical protein
MARVELLEQELERAHERDRETRWLLAAALERIPPQLEAPAESTDPLRRSRRSQRGRSPAPVRGRVRRANGAPGGVGYLASLAYRGEAMLAAFVKSVTIKDTHLPRRGKPMRLNSKSLTWRRSAPTSRHGTCERLRTILGNKVCRSSSTTSRSTSSVFPKMAASPSVRRLQIGNGCRSVGTFTCLTSTGTT